MEPVRLQWKPDVRIDYAHDQIVVTFALKGDCDATWKRLFLARLVRISPTVYRLSPTIDGDELTLSGLKAKAVEEVMEKLRETVDHTNDARRPGREAVEAEAQQVYDSILSWGQNDSN